MQNSLFVRTPWGEGLGIMAAEKMTERKSGRKGSGAASWARVCRALST